MLLFNNHEVLIKQFPNGESIIDKPFFKDHEREFNNEITFKYESDGDLLKLLLVRKSLWFPCILRILSFPYSRMDRHSEEYSFTLKSICKYVNWMEWEKVIIYDPHSDVTPALLNHCKVLSVIPDLFLLTDFNKDKDYILYPDAGAQKRYSSLLGGKAIVGFKSRQFSSGKITNLKIIGNIESGSRVFIVDDICSKGTTFSLAAKELKKMGSEDIFLVVAHCEENIFNGELLLNDLVKKIYTTSSIININQANDKLIIFKI